MPETQPGSRNNQPISLPFFTASLPTKQFEFSPRSDQPKTESESYPCSPEVLNNWIAEHTGHKVPSKAVCPDHDAPLDFIADLFFEEESDALVLANRAGGKTENVAALHLANAYWKPGHETAHIGAIQPQSRRCYAYYRKGLRHPSLQQLAPDPHITETEWSNGSRIEIMPGTEAQTQGGHPQLVTFDELEQGKRQPYENAKSMPVEWFDAAGKRHPGQFIATSTRQSGMGMMQRALDEATENGMPIYTWCVMETIDGKTCRKDGVPLCDGCAIQEDCQGRALDADGWRSRDEILTIYGRVGRDTWEAQHLCLKPDAKALIYAPFSAANITPEAEYLPDGGQIWISYDWGFTDPTHICFVQQRGEAFYQFDELTGSNRSEREWVRAIVRRIVGLPDYEGPTMEQWEKIWERNEWPERWPSMWPEAVGDPSAVQMRAELKAHGITAARAQLVKHEVEAGQDVLRAAILSGGELRRLFVHPRCVQTIRCLTNYRARELADGSFDPRPDPDPANHAFSHGCDSLRYLFWRLRRALGIAGGQEESE